MKILRSLGIVALAVTMLLRVAVAADAGVVRLVTTEWPPYVGAKLKDGGFANAIVRAAFAEVGYDVDVKYYPWKRAMRLVREGKADAVYPAYYSAERTAIYQYSESFTNGPLVLFVRKDKPFSYEKLLDLKGRKIGVVLGYANTEEFDKATYINKVVSNTDTNNLRSLLDARVDMAVSDKFTGLHILKTQFPDKRALVEPVEPALEDKSVHLLFSKQTARHAELARAFNEGLAKLQKAGRIQEILADHGL